MFEIIKDNLKYCSLYYGLNKNFEKAFDFIKDYQRKPLEAGTYEIDGKAVYAMVMDCELKNNARLEAHKEYIDIQFVVSGVEVMQYAVIDALELDEDLTPKKDLLFYKDTEKADNLKFYPNDFAIFFPNDAHKPCLKSKGNDKVTKIVVKIKI